MRRGLLDATGNAGGRDVLAVKNLTAAYGGTTVLRGVSLRVASGQITALLGPNGAGKTSLLRAVSGLLPAKAGSVHLLGHDVTRLPVHRRFQMGLCHIPEGRGIFRSLTVRENLLMQAPKGDYRPALDAAVAAFPVLGERLVQKAGTLSGGEQQMLAMAAAYVRRAGVILVDEASLGLAPLAVDQIFSFLKKVKDSGTSILLIDQFANRVLPLATTAYVLRQGSLVYEGSAAELTNEDLFAQYLGRDE